MRLPHLCLMTAASLAALPFTAPARADLLINVDKAKQEMTVTVDGEQRYVWPVSTGRQGYDTPDGDFKPFRMEKDHFSREWDDAPMPNSIFFTKIGHAIHGTYETKNLGRPVSHGCVRLSRANSAILWSLVKHEKMANTRVVLTGEIPGGGGVPVARRQPDNSYSRSYGTDDDQVVTARQLRAARGWREESNGGRYYYYREQPYVAPRYERGRGLFSFPFGW
jgi:hypothetical protein